MDDERTAKILSEQLDELLESAEPVFRRFAQSIDTAAETGRERFEARREELLRRRDKLDKNLDRRFR